MLLSKDLWRLLVFLTTVVPFQSLSPYLFESKRHLNQDVWAFLFSNRNYDKSSPKSTKLDNFICILFNFLILSYTHHCIESCLLQRSGYVMLMRDSKREEFLWHQIKSTTVWYTELQSRLVSRLPVMSLESLWLHIPPLLKVIFALCSSYSRKVPYREILYYFLFLFSAGALTGKYTPENPPSGPRGRIYTREFLTKVIIASYTSPQVF